MRISDWSSACALPILAELVPASDGHLSLPDGPDGGHQGNGSHQPGPDAIDGRQCTDGIGGACELHDTGGRLADADGRDRLRHAERAQLLDERPGVWRATVDRKSTRLNSSH